MQRSADLVVLGAGPAGLAAAWRAAQRGLSVVVLERAAAVGGLAGSVEVAGMRVDRGSHRLHAATPAHLLADLRGLLGDDLQTHPRRGRLRVAGRWLAFPLRAKELARRLPPSMAAGIARDAATGALRRGPDTYAGKLRKSLGPTIYDALYAPYAEKLWGLRGEDISADQAHQRVPIDTAWKVAGRVLRPHRGGPGSIFHYPRRGFGQLTDALADAATAAGASIFTDAAVDRLQVGRDSVAAHTSDGREVRARRAFSTLPLPALVRLASPGAPLGAVESASRLRFRAMVLVYVVHLGGRWSPYDTHFLPGPETPITRISEPANYRVSAEDPKDRSVLCAEVPCAVGDAIWTASDEALGSLVDEALHVTGLPPVRRAGVHVERIRHVYPVYALGYERHLEALETWASSLPSVTTFGRLALFAHEDTHHTLSMAYDAVDAFLSPDRDARAWSAAGERFARVVED